MQVTPIYTAQIKRKAVRFFRTPIEDGFPDLPWHCVDDLFEAANLPLEMRVNCLRQAKRDYPHFYPTVSVGGEPVTIAPHFSAAKMIEALGVGKLVKISFAVDYLKAAKSAYFSQPEARSKDHLERALDRWLDPDMLH